MRITCCGQRVAMEGEVEQGIQGPATVRGVAKGAGLLLFHRKGVKK